MSETYQCQAYLLPDTYSYHSGEIFNTIKLWYVGLKFATLARVKYIVELLSDQDTIGRHKSVLNSFGGLTVSAVSRKLRVGGYAQLIEYILCVYIHSLCLCLFDCIWR